MAHANTSNGIKIPIGKSWGMMLYLSSASLSIVYTDIDRRSQNSYTAMRNGIVRYGAPVRGIQVFADHPCGNKCKQNASTWQSWCAVWFSHIYLHAQAAVRMYLTNHGYFDHGKSQNTPNREFLCFGLASILEVQQKSLQHGSDPNSLCSNQSGEWPRISNILRNAIKPIRPTCLLAQEVLNRF